MMLMQRVNMDVAVLKLRELSPVLVSSEDTLLKEINFLFHKNVNILYHMKTLA